MDPRQRLPGIPVWQANVKMDRMCYQFQTRPATVHLSLPGSCPAVTHCPLVLHRHSPLGWLVTLVLEGNKNYFNCDDDCQGSRGSCRGSRPDSFVLVGVSTLTYTSRYVYRDGGKAGGQESPHRWVVLLQWATIPCPVSQFHQQ